MAWQFQGNGCESSLLSVITLILRRLAACGHAFQD